MYDFTSLVWSCQYIAEGAPTYLAEMVSQRHLRFCITWWSGSTVFQNDKIWTEKLRCLWSNSVEHSAANRVWPRAITDTDSVLCTLEDHAVLQNLWNTIIAPQWQFRLQRLLHEHKCTYLLTVAETQILLFHWCYRQYIVKTPLLICFSKLENLIVNSGDICGARNSRYSQWNDGCSTSVPPTTLCTVLINCSSAVYSSPNVVNLELLVAVLQSVKVWNELTFLTLSSTINIFWIQSENSDFYIVYQVFIFCFIWVLLLYCDVWIYLVYFTAWL